MSDHKPNPTETILRKSSWVAFLAGGGLIALASIYENSERETQERADYYRGEVEAGRIEVRPGTRVMMDEMRRKRQDPDYAGTRAIGFLLLFTGLGLSLYENKLRKKRVGE
jgi:hypothetical protein